MTLRIVDTLDGMRAIRPAYEQIAASSQASPFVSWEWLYHWWKAAGGDYDVRLLTFWNGSEEMEGALPLMLVKHGLKRLGVRELRFASDCVLASPAYMDLVAYPGRERDCLEAAFSYLINDRSWDRAELSRLRADSTTFPLFCQLAAQHGLRVEVRQNVWCRYIPLPDSFDQYLAGLSPNRRGQIRNLRNRANKAYPLRFTECADLESLHRALDKYFLDKAGHMDLKGKWTQFHDPAYQQFMRCLAVDLWEKGRFRLWCIQIDGEVAAVAYGIVANGVYYLKNYSYDERYTKHRLGHVLLGYCIERCIDHERLRVFDFLSTEYPYKAHYAKGRELMVKLVLYRQSTRSLSFEAIAHLSALPAAALRRRHAAGTTPEPSAEAGASR